MALPADAEDRHRLRLSLERPIGKRLDRLRGAEGPDQRLAGKDVAGPGLGAEVGGDVDRVADHRVVEPPVAADVAREDLAHVDPDADRQGAAPLALPLLVERLER